jgi:hypothetical protein
MKRAFWSVFLAATLIFIPLWLQLREAQTQPTLLAPYPPPMVTPAPTPNPYPKPGSESIQTSSSLDEESVIVTIELDVSVEGLESQTNIELRLLPGTEKTSGDLARVDAALPSQVVENGLAHVVAEDIPVGVYLLMADASQDYFREPQGYLFRVSDAGIIRTSASPFHFKLIPPSEQSLPPCRNIETMSNLPESRPAVTDFPLEKQNEICMAEGIFDLSDPRNLLRPNGQEKSGVLLSNDYHWIGPRTSQDNRGVLGRNYVVDPNVIHDGSANQFVAERVYADNDVRWIEAGWSEDSWKDERQYIYVLGAAQEWRKKRSFAETSEQEKGSIPT